jgi:hypothetical protein
MVGLGKYEWATGRVNAAWVWHPQISTVRGQFSANLFDKFKTLYFDKFKKNIDKFKTCGYRIILMHLINAMMTVMDSVSLPEMLVVIPFLVTREELEHLGSAFHAGAMGCIQTWKWIIVQVFF